MTSPTVVLSTRLLVLVLVIGAPLSAQARRAKENVKAKASAAATAELPIVGTWSGRATVPLGDSTIVVPVSYTFTQTGTTIGGTAMVPGQGSGPIGNVVRDGSRLRFRVTAPEGKLLEHDGTLGADGAIEGMVNLDNQPVAKFRIAPRPVTTPPK
jgi:hypothetical protein